MYSVYGTGRCVANERAFIQAIDLLSIPITIVLCPDTTRTFKTPCVTHERLRQQNYCDPLECVWIHQLHGKGNAPN